MTFEDWRDCEPAEIAPLYAAECARYRAALSWDLAPSCRIVEDARRAGRLPGLVLRAPSGAIAGWGYFIVHDGVLQVGGLVADSASRLRRLLDRVLQSHEAAAARSLTAFVFPVSPSLQSAFERQRFSVEPHPYLSRPTASLEGESGPALGSEFVVRPLAQTDPADVIRLTARCYEGQSEARCFAPDGRLDQWAHYLGQLLATPACGWYLPAASFAVERRDTRQPVGAVITTAISEDTAHIAQIVVDPGCRRAGIARALVAAALASSRKAGHARLSLIVSGDNDPARRLYDRLGFQEAGSFIYASRAALSRRLMPPPLASRAPAAITQRSPLTR